MFDSFRNHSLGVSLPDDHHAVSCSLPTLASIIGYEEKDPAVVQKLKAGYPRFTRHPYISQLCKQLAGIYKLKAEAVYVLANQLAADLLVHFIETTSNLDTSELSIQQYDGLIVVFSSNSDLNKIIYKFLQHSGISISSRQAWHYLNKSSSPVTNPESTSKICSILGKKHNTLSASDVYLGKSGMSCFYAAFRTLHEIQAQRNKKIWIQLGWLYIDTMETMKAFAKHSDDYKYFADVLDLKSLESYIQKNNERIAGIITESPTNPLIQTMDIEAIYAITQKYELAFILDPTIASPHNIKCLEFCDIAINSLTKYAAHKGNVMMGSLALNHKSSFYKQLKKQIPKYLIEPYDADQEELLGQIQDYDRIINQMNANNIELSSYLEKHSLVKRVYHAYSPDYSHNYQKIQKHTEAPGCLLSIELNMPLARFYDKISIAKGPSFGQEFTILCPFIYLAHYDLINSTAGREFLNQNRMPAELIRISVGTESSLKIIQAFERALT